MLAKADPEKGHWRIVVLEEGTLPFNGRGMQGSTGHAPGAAFGTKDRLGSLHAQETRRQLADMELHNEPCIYKVGGIELATTPARHLELKHRRGTAETLGMPAEILSPHEVGKKLPLLDTDTILSGLWTPDDGIVKAVRASEVCMHNAQNRGVPFYDNTPVQGITVKNGKVSGVQTAYGEIQTNLVISCAGIWGPKLGRMAGITVPMYPMQHPLVWTESLSELASFASMRDEVVRPMVRHQDTAMYFRHWFDMLAVGSYWTDAMPVNAEDIKAMWECADTPSVMEFDADQFKKSWAEAQRLMPALRKLDLAANTRGFNGLMSFTPDGLPVIGWTQVGGLFSAQAIWITDSLGYAKSVAEVIVKGASTLDIGAADINRFPDSLLSDSHIRGRASREYLEVYDIKHPQAQADVNSPLRGLLKSPFYARQQELGAVFHQSATGWEMPYYYEANAGLVKKYGTQITPRQDEWSRRYWSKIVGAEHLALRESVGMVDMTPLAQLTVSGRGAARFLQRVTTSNIKKLAVGGVKYTTMLEPNGGIKSDVTVTRVGKYEFRVGSNGPADLAWLKRQVNGSGRSVQIEDITEGSCCVGLWGPKAREVLQKLADIDPSNSNFRYFTAKQFFVGSVSVLALRVSYVGELGWELYTSAANGLRLWDLLMEAGQPHGIVPVGRGAFNSLRVEKCNRSFGTDMSAEHTPYEAGLGFTVDFNKDGEFIGKSALALRHVDQELCCLKLDDSVQLMMGGEPVYVVSYDKNGKLSYTGEKGYVTSAAHGYSVQESLAFAWLPPAQAEPGTRVQIEYFGRRYGAKVVSAPRFDPKNLRPKS
jgi:glycine cleavage system aminomethyltransferase T/glycine/D-amino acid oxidase-like deaminating enzyme